MTAHGRPRRWAGAVVIVAVLALAAACASGPPVASNDVPPPATVGERISLVTLGGNETLSGGLDDSGRQPWTQQVFAALPPSATFANLASSDASVAAGVAEQLPKALAEEPTIATLWFGGGDAALRTSTGEFSASLTSLVAALQAKGARVLLIARSVPDNRTARYLAAVADVATATGATLVSIEGRDVLRSNAGEQTAVANAVKAAL